MLQPRLDKLRKTLKEKRLDAFLVSNSYNILYLSGFKTLTDNEREAWLFITAKNSYLFSDSRYLSFPPRNMVRDKLQRAIVPLGKSRKIDPPVKPEDDGLERKLITPENSLIKHLKRIIVEEKIRTLGIEGEDLKINEFNKLKQELRVEVVPTERLIIKQREIKDGEEIKLILDFDVDKSVIKPGDKYLLKPVIKIIAENVNQTNNCGNGNLDSGESCDGSNLNNKTCTDFNFNNGTLNCNNCNIVNTNCFNSNQTVSVCGNNIIENNEQCEGSDFNSVSCSTYGFNNGTLSCNNCTRATSGCFNSNNSTGNNTG